MASTALTEREIEAAVQVLRSGKLRQGPVCGRFETRFAEMTGASHAVSCANGSAALHLCYLDFLRPGDEVLVPSFTFIATATMVSAAGGTPVFVDVDPDTFLIDLDDAARKITPRTRAISPVHLFGNPCDVTAVQQLAREHDLTVVWDAAQAHGAKFDGRDVGSAGDYVCYSFYPTKNLFVGEGGMVCTPDAARAERLRLLRSHGQEQKYLHTVLGLNYRMTDIAAAIGEAQLDRLPSMIATRQRNAERLREQVERIPGLKCQTVTPGGQHAWHQFCITVDPSVYPLTRDAVLAHVKQHGIQCGVHYPRGVHQQPIYDRDERLPVTEDLTKRILAVPIHHGLTDEDIDQIGDALRGPVEG